MGKDKKLKIAYILGCFPDNTPTFVYNEIKGLDQLGLDITIFSIHKSPNNKNDLAYDTWKPRTIYAEPPYSLEIIFSHIYFLFMKPYVYFKLLFQYKKFGGKKAFWEGVYFSRVIKKMEIEHVHAHFAWKATDVARIIKQLTSIPYSFTAHQSDIHRVIIRLKEKVKNAKFVITCTKGNRDFISKKYGKEIESKTHTIYHGVDLELFSPENIKADKELDIISVGNLLDVKGFIYLIEACRILDKKRIVNKCIIVGEGQEKDNLQETINRYNLQGKIEILKKIPQNELAKLYAKANIFALPVTVIDGAPHGIPNVIAEAMAMGIPVVSSNVPNIPELIEHNKDGILVKEKDPVALADALEKLLNDNNKCTALGKKAREKIKNRFDAKKHLNSIAEIFKDTI